MSLFKVNHTFDVVLNPDAVKLCRYLTKVDCKQLLYIVLAYDHTDGPFRMQPPEERVNMAMKKVYGKMDPKIETKAVKLAAQEYQELIFDIRRVTTDVYKKKTVYLQRELLKEDITPGKIRELDGAISFLQGRVRSMEEELSFEEKSEHDVKGGKRISYVEKWQLNQKRAREQALSR